MIPLPQPAQMVSRVARITALFLVAFSACAGPIGFEHSELHKKAEALVNCGGCAFITTYDTIEPLPDPMDTWIVLGWMATLGVIGLLGVRFRVYARRDPTLRVHKGKVVRRSRRASVKLDSTRSEP